MVETFTFQTTLGSVPLRGLRRGKLTVLALNGMFAHPTEMGQLPLALDRHGFGALVGLLPGFGSPLLAETSIAAFARAFDEVADQVGPVVVLGHSAGALIALSMRSRNVRRILAVEPPLETAKLWQLGPRMVETFSEHSDFYRGVIGYDGRTFTGRNYLHLLDELPVPTDFVVGDQPTFPTRPLAAAASSVDEAQRLLIRRSRNAALHIAPNAGHIIQREAPVFLFEVLLRTCEAALQFHAGPLGVD